MKNIIYFLILAFHLNSFAAGILNSRCFLINPDGALNKLNSAIGCNDTIKSFDQNSAEGSDRWGKPFVIEISNKNGVGNFDVFEAKLDSLPWDISAHYPSLTTTIVKDGKVADRTVCDRDLKKTEPIVKRDSLTCVTITQEFCDKFYGKLKERRYGFEPEVPSSKQIAECSSVIRKQMSALTSTISESWADKKYHDLAQMRFEQTRQKSDKFLNKDLAAKAKFNYNLSDSNPKSGTNAILEIGRGYGLMEDMFEQCEALFPDPQISASSKSKDSAR